MLILIFLNFIFVIEQALLVFTSFMPVFCARFLATVGSRKRVYNLGLILFHHFLCWNHCDWYLRRYLGSWLFMITNHRSKVSLCRILFIFNLPTFQIPTRSKLIILLMISFINMFIGISNALILIKLFLKF